MLLLPTSDLTALLRDLRAEAPTLPVSVNELGLPLLPYKPLRNTYPLFRMLHWDAHASGQFVCNSVWSCVVCMDDGINVCVRA